MYSFKLCWDLFMDLLNLFFMFCTYDQCGTTLLLGCAGYGVLLAAEKCSDTLITHPLHTSLHIRGQLILIMFRGAM